MLQYKVKYEYHRPNGNIYYNAIFTTELGMVSMSRNEKYVIIAIDYKEEGWK